MSSLTIRLSPGVTIEHVGDQVLALNAGAKEIVAVTGTTGKLLQRVSRPGSHAITVSPELEELLSLGLVQKTVTRRGVIRAGALGAGAGVAFLAMPSVAMASSTPPVNTTRFRLSTMSGDPFFESSIVNGPPRRYVYFELRVRDDSGTFTFPENTPGVMTLEGGRTLDLSFFAEAPTSDEPRFVWSQGSAPNLLDTEIEGKAFTLSFTFEGVDYLVSFTPTL